MVRHGTSSGRNLPQKSTGFHTIFHTADMQDLGEISSFFSQGDLSWPKVSHAGMNAYALLHSSWGLGGNECREMLSVNLSLVSPQGEHMRRSSSSWSQKESSNGKRFPVPSPDWGHPSNREQLLPGRNGVLEKCSSSIP